MTGMANFLVLNPDELGQDPVVGMNLAVSLGIEALEMRTAYGANLLMLDLDQARRIRAEADARGLRVEALASPLWKWCRPDATPGRVDSFGFPARVPDHERAGWVEKALAVAEALGARYVRVFSHLRVEGDLTETFDTDPLVPWALGRAKEAGIRLLLENEPVCTLSAPEQLLHSLRTHDGLGLWLDLGNLHEVGGMSFVADLAEHADYIHVKDFRMDGGRRVFCPAGSGEVPFKSALDVLHTARPGLPFALETHVRGTPADAIEQGARYLRTVGSFT